MFKTNIPLKELNSIRTKASAKMFFAPSSINELIEGLRSNQEKEILILGGGNNLFFTKDYEGLVIKLNLRGINIVEENDETVIIEAMASEDWNDFVSFCVERGYSGIENLSMIPGTVGASPIQNIGAYGSEVKDTIVKVKTIEIDSMEERVFSNEECQFGYRDSYFKRSQEHIVTSVQYCLSKKFTYIERYKDLNEELKETPTPTLSEVREAVDRVRRRKLPDHNEIPNSGSFFKNPFITSEQKEKLLSKLPAAPIFNISDNRYKTSAAFLIDKAGCKKMEYNGVSTHENQPLIIINKGTESGKDIVCFMQRIQNSVREAFDIELSPEVQIY